MDFLRDAHQLNLHPDGIKRLNHTIVKLHTNAISFFEKSQSLSLFTQSGSGNRKRGVARHHFNQPLILFGEGSAIVAIREIQHAKQKFADDNGHTQKPVHMGMIGWKTYRARIILDMFKSYGLAFSHNSAEQTPSLR